MILHQAGDARRRAGIVVVLVAASMVAIMGMLALSLDGGVIQSERRHAQGTADAAALAAAGQLYYYYWSNSGQDSNGAGNTAALAAAAQNGYANDGSAAQAKANTSTFVVNIPPTSGIYAGRAGYAEVIVTNYLPARLQPSIRQRLGPGRRARRRRRRARLPRRSAFWS